MKTIKTWADLISLIASDFVRATDEELTALYNRIAKPYNNSPMDIAMMDGYDKPEYNEAVQRVYWAIVGEQDRRYKEAHEDDLRAYFNKYFKGKTWETIRKEQEALEEAYNAGKRGDELPKVGDWSFYSDYHKDVYGYRPHGVVCGEYMRPW